MAFTAAGLIYGNEEYYLDHLAPLCSLLSIPLVVTDDHIAYLAKTFYPDLQVIHWIEQEISMKLVLNFHTIFYTTPRILFEEYFFFAQHLLKKIIRTIWVPHGNSDKGRTTPFMEALQEENILLIYGQRMKQFLREKNVQGKLVHIGNFRKKYFHSHKTFYQKILPSYLNKQAKKTLLYAPTWMDLEKNSSFISFFPILVKNLPKHVQCIVKLHPNLYKQYPEEIQEYKKHLPNGIFFLENFPSIYPILEHVDTLIWDGSSIGYDFLAFHRPMIFLNQNGYPENHPNLFLAKVRLNLCEYDRFYSDYISLEKTSHSHKSFYKAAYKETFSAFNINKLKKIIY